MIAWSFLSSCHDAPPAQSPPRPPVRDAVVLPGEYRLTVVDGPSFLPSTVWVEPEVGASKVSRWGELKPHLAETTGLSDVAIWVQYEDGTVELTWASESGGIRVSLEAAGVCTWEGTASSFYGYLPQASPKLRARLECLNG